MNNLFRRLIPRYEAFSLFVMSLTCILILFITTLSKTGAKEITDASASSRMFQVTATVISIDAAAKTFTIRHKKGNLSLLADDKLMEQLADVRIGDIVTVKYKETGGETIATSIRTPKVAKKGITSKEAKVAKKPESKQYLDSNSKICGIADREQLSDLIKRVISVPMDACTLVNLSAEDLKLLRNSIFARYGYIFQEQELSTYFDKMPWYKKDTAFSISKLTNLQKTNVEMIRLIESLTRTKKQANDESARNFEEIDNPNFQRAADFLLPISSLPQQHEFVEFKDNKLLFKKTLKVVDLSIRSKKEYQIHEIIPEQPDWRVIEKGILVRWPFSYSGTEGSGCNSEYYSFDGKLLGVSVCPDYVFKNNNNLFVELHYSGCCGSYAWDFGLFNLLSGEAKAFSCPDNACQAVLLTYLNQSNELLASLLVGSHQAGAWAYQTSDFWLFDKDGNENSHSQVIQINMFLNESGTAFQISNLVGVIRIPGKKEWLFKFIDNNEAYYLLISADKIYRPSKAAMLIDAHAVQDEISANIYINDIYKGKTPYSEFITPGKYRLKLKLQGYQDHEEIIEMKKGEIFQTWPYLQPLPK